MENANLIDIDGATKKYNKLLTDIQKLLGDIQNLEMAKNDLENIIQIQIMTISVNNLEISFAEKNYEQLKENMRTAIQCKIKSMKNRNLPDIKKNFDNLNIICKKIENYIVNNIFFDIRKTLLTITVIPIKNGTQ